MTRRILLIAAAAALSLFGEVPAAAQLRVTVDNPDRCESAAQQIVPRVYYYRKLEIDQRYFNRIRREVTRNASYQQEIAALDRWARDEPAALARRCRLYRPSRSRPWIYEYRN